MSSKEVIPDFILHWDINSLMDLIALSITPVWLRVLEAATEKREVLKKDRHVSFTGEMGGEG